MTGMDIKFGRIRAGLKGYQLARLLEITPDIMSKIENDHIVPSKKLITRIKKYIK